MKTLGKFQKVELRDFWEDEARDFTPWLAQDENIEILSEAIGIDIEIEGKEVPAGSYKVDLVGRDISNNKKIIIENQLEKSNHDHLGKIITYAAGIEASVVIWICKSITEEHRKAIDWLNENTNDDTHFFGIEIELWKIDGSNPAPQFNIICRPNEWAKSVKNASSSSSRDMTEMKSLQLEFWNYLKEYFNQKHTILRLRTPRAQHWYSIAIGKSKFQISLTVNSFQNRLGCEIYIRGENAKKAFSELEKDKDLIEKELGVELSWQELPDGRDSRIIFYGTGSIKDRVKWDEMSEWFRKYAELFYKVFSVRVKKIKS
ncbi:MAG: DUF4268 domain-containing protein [Chitinispirillia bacterium]|nr:DUF4268 domain-containing protein [Chitinispirillia bacterium]